MDQVVKHTIAIVLSALLASFPGCTGKKAALPPLSVQDSLSILQAILAHRTEMDEYFRASPYSPFVGDTSAHFEGIRWFPPNLSFYFRSNLIRFSHPETVIVMGTKGEARRQLKYGYFEIPWRGETFRLNTYKDVESPQGMRQLAIWFTDSTTNRDTYGVGRYLDVGEEHDDPAHLYVLDFNRAYNPYCAYSSRYSCAIPRKEDHLDFSVRAGELKYHP